MRDCVNGEVRDRLPELVHERLSATERGAVLAHVSGCAECAAELALLHELRGALAVAPAVDVSRIMASLPPAPGAAVPVGDPKVVPIGAARRRAPAVRASWGGRWRVAAAIATLMVGGTSVGILTRQRGDAGVAPAVRTADGSSPRGAPAPAAPAPVAGAAAPTSQPLNRSGAAPALAPVQVASRAGDVDQVGGGLLADATDAELQALIDEIEQFDGTPVVEPEPVSPAATTNGTRGGA